MQEIAAILIVILAAAYLARRAWQSVLRRTGSSCGGCASCPSNRAAEAQQLVALDGLAFGQQRRS